MSESFCTECGAKLKEGQAFCTSCGKSHAAKKNVPVSQPVTRAAIKKPVSKRKKIVLFLTSLVIILLAGTHFLLTYLSQNDRQLTAIYNAVIDGNQDDFFSEVTVKDNPVYNPKTFLVNVKKKGFTEVYRNLDEAVGRVRETGLTETITDSDGVDVFRVKQEKLLYFYPKAQIELMGHELVIHSDLENTSVTIGSKTIDLAGKSIAVKNVLPDDYTVTLKGKNTYFESNGTVQIERGQFSTDPQIDLLAENYTLQIDSKHKDSLLFINDVSTEKTLEELSALSPFFGDSTVVQAVRTVSDDETEASDKVTAKQGELVTFNFPLLAKAEVEKKEKAENDARKKTKEQDMIKSASMAYSNFRDSYEDALNYQNFNYIEPYLYGNGNAYGELKKFITEIDDSHFYYNFITNEVISGSIKDDKIYLNVLEVFNFENHLYETIRYERNKEYVLVEVTPEYFEIAEINIEETKTNKE